MDEEISDPTYRIQKITIVTPENSDSIVVSNKHILEAKNAGTTTAQITLVSTKNEEETLDCQVMIIVHEVEKLTIKMVNAQTGKPGQTLIDGIDHGIRFSYSSCRI